MANGEMPTLSEFNPMVLRVLSDGKEHYIGDLRTEVADFAQLTDEQRAEVLPSGVKRYTNRIDWACVELRMAGLIDRPQRAHYRITDTGRIVDGRDLTVYTQREMAEWPAWVAYQEEIAARNASADDTSGSNGATPDKTGDDNDETVDAIAVLAKGEKSFNANTETELRRRLQESSPEFFEKAVIELLWAMGYGGSHGDKQHAGRTGDGGIDGVIREDALGLQNIYIQAKRYSDANTVGSGEIRNFIGALDGHGADRGVFITTSTFTQAAELTAENCRHSKIILIDGIRLTSLMLNYGVAVQKAREFTLFALDEDFFDEGLL